MSKISFDKILVIITVVAGALLQLIDSSIVNVSLTQMMGNLGATLGDISWVVTGYTTSTIIMITLSGWLSAKLGRKVYFTASIILFTVASVFCGLSTSISQLILFRIIQGIGGGGLLTTAQAILIDTFPREELGTANAIFGMGVIIGPSIGPTLGGYITDHLSWHWIFFINIPVGIVASILSILYVRDSEYRLKTGKMDWAALVLLILTIGSLQIILEKGQEKDWFQSNFITALTVISIFAGILFVFRQLKVENPILNLRLLKNRQYAIGTSFGFVQGIGLYASVFVIPIFCQSMLDYTAKDTGWLMLPGSLAAGVMMPVVATVMKKTKISPVVLAGIGFSSFVLFVWLLSGMNQNTGAGDFFWPLILRGVGLGLLFIPLLTITIYPLHNKDVPQATAFTTMVRQLGGAFGIAMATTYISIRSVFHYSNLSEHVSIFNSISYDRLQSYAHLFMSKGSDLASSYIKAAAAIKGNLMKQAMILTYNDVFLIVGVFFAACIPFLLLFKTKHKKGEDSEIRTDQLIE
ncbi:DHA2 family efflux MFS transporter permease subunit [Saccharicrinis sp. FJH54]|uniref:DHA2 family efflux MFS transporter permease subunit n=1 Tax=Saccharicrinis sp. FJH54 TaxID=3344665 RepID=UPI0035D51D97